ncbi:hypothetical protein Htur_0034 [Haloterrigena turkmenica DSM 5511]|uniref:Uncharacterized protein n=1 Tax=Haloterrigena turkmenica (strain ATCC 51198 / DSM 5511 / JCM 9101 / NCIMB 13204 / VKM B-1734 / 4k) TaxID=543526 RepID=D2RSW1_HALTV|nr:hypothetical protein Htur_0034 [Haloterrigena turkmenica DSM 5511]
MASVSGSNSGFRQIAGEVDVKGEGEVSIGGETYQSPAIESKHWNPEKWPADVPFDDLSWSSQLTELVEKRVTQAVKGEDTVIASITIHLLPNQPVQTTRSRRLENI